MTITQRPINVDKVRQKLEKLKNPRAFKKNPDRWSPIKLGEKETDGEVSNIRLIRYPYDDDPFLELYFHYGVGEGSHRNFLCLKRNSYIGKACPACEFASELWAKDSLKDKELAKNLFANNRQHAVCVDRADKVLTPRYWGFGVNVYNELASKLSHPEYKDYMDYYNGIDLEVKYVKTNPSLQHPSTSVTFSRGTRALAESDGEISKIVDMIKKPAEIWQPLTKSEIDSQLSGWLTPESGAEDASSETVKGGNGKISADDITEDSSPLDVEAAFTEALPATTESK